MSGSVYKDGTTYRVRWTSKTGKRRSKSGFPTKREASLYLSDRIREVRLGVEGEGFTFEDVASEMLDSHTASESQVSKLRSMVSNHVTFGALPVRNVSPAILMRWQAQLPTEHVRYTATAAVKQILTYAERMQYIEQSPARHVKNPQPKSPDITPFGSWEELARLDDLLGGLVTVAVGTGMRPQEWSKLRWEHVDLAGRAIVLPASVAKTGEARRIPLRRRVVEVLAGMQQSTGLVFGIEDLRSWRRYTWTPALVACELEYRRPYEMRHTYATWALRAGVSTFLVARRMGTSVAMIDKTYGQFAIDTEDHELRLLDAYDSRPLTGQVEPSPSSHGHTHA